jgi:fructose-1-phosphate kinase PfkB-like protein
MSRRVATITLNPAYDLVGFTPEIERGEVNLVRTTGLHAAGNLLIVSFLVIVLWFVLILVVFV